VKQPRSGGPHTLKPVRLEASRASKCEEVLSATLRNVTWHFQSHEPFSLTKRARKCDSKSRLSNEQKILTTRTSTMLNSYNNAKFGSNRADTLEISLNVPTVSAMGILRTFATLSLGV
jgi:hypothetical protein